MPELVHDKKVFSLLEVTSSIQRTIADRYKSVYWVKAEMNKLNHYPHSGHCYPDLVEKTDGKVIAQMRCSLWRDDFNRINHKFRTLVKEPLHDGITILFAATINFDPVHGLTLRILDIDPVFSLGELERERIETIERLQKDGIFSRNKTTTLPLIPKKVAVISVETSKGYADYLKIIDGNPFGYKIHNFLFPSLLQGERSIPSILNQLKRIRKLIHHFDCVAIIRGGGGDVGLSSFNHYVLAREIAMFPIPVFTGIGHSTNETVVEMVAFRNAITPTELADQLLQRFHNFAEPIKRAEGVILDRSRQILLDQSRNLINTARLFQSVTRNKIGKSHHQLSVFSGSVHQHLRFILKHEGTKLREVRERIARNVDQLCTNLKSEKVRVTGRMSVAIKQVLNSESDKLQSVEKHVQVLDPANVLRRGFSITLDQQGKVVTEVSQLHAGQAMTTIVADGKIISTVTQSKSETNNND